MSDNYQNDDYVLGTHDREIERLWLQHRVWREQVSAVWQRAGFGQGDRIADIGCGPGFAAAELAQLAGTATPITAIDRSERFLELTQRHVRDAGFDCNIIQADLDQFELSEAAFDGIWCRWVATFVTNPRRLITQFARGLAPGGVAVFHEYLHYGAWRLIPRVAEFEELVSLIQQSWRDAGGEPDIATCLPAWLEAEGLEVEIHPLIFSAQKEEPMWQWPAAFVENSLERLQEIGLLDSQAANRIDEAWRIACAKPGTRMITPCVGAIIARRSNAA